MKSNYFWLVWNPNGCHAPKYRHETGQSAEDEAKRLARLHPGQEFFVLCAVGVAKKVDVEYVPFEADEIPF